MRHRQQVNDYLRERKVEAAKLRQEIEARQPDRDQLRAQLLARRGRQEDGNGCVEYLTLLTGVIFGAALGLNALGGFVSGLFAGLSLRLSTVLG